MKQTIKRHLNKRKYTRKLRKLRKKYTRNMRKATRNLLKKSRRFMKKTYKLQRGGMNVNQYEKALTKLQELVNKMNEKGLNEEKKVELNHSMRNLRQKIKGYLKEFPEVKPPPGLGLERQGEAARSAQAMPTAEEAGNFFDDLSRSPPATTICQASVDIYDGKIQNEDLKKEIEKIVDNPNCNPKM